MLIFLMFILDNDKCLGWREKNKPYQWLNYNESLLRAKNFGCGLVHLGKKNYAFWILIFTGSSHGNWRPLYLTKLFYLLQAYNLELM